MKRGSKVLRFAVTGALAVSPLRGGCGEDESEHTIFYSTLETEVPKFDALGFDAMRARSECSPV